MSVPCSSAISAASEILSTIAKNRSSFELLLSSLERNEIGRVCTDVREFFEWSFNYQEFYKSICCYLYPPLEFLWHLHIFQVMPFEIYLSMVYSKVEAFTDFQKNIFLLCCQEHEKDVAFFTQSGVLSYLVSKAFAVVQGDEHEEKLKEICSVLVKNVVQGVFSTEERDIETLRFRAFLALWSSGTLDQISLYRFCSFVLLCFLDLHPTEADVEAYCVQENVKNKAAPFHLQFILEKVVKILDSSELMHILESAAKKSSTNWKSYVVVITSFVMTHKEALFLICKMTANFQKDAYDCTDQILLCKSLLISRQVALTSNAALYASYKYWLQETFNNCIKLKKAHSYSLLIKVLSDFVPLERNTECLKALIDFPLSVPPEHQSSYADYIILLKTRMRDLKPELRPEQTIEKVLIAFQELGKIPPVILEASLIQKHKFLNEFLPALLAPRIVPQIPDVREKFIEALDKIGKIPSNLLQKYKMACLQEKEKFIAGAFEYGKTTSDV